MAAKNTADRRHQRRGVSFAMVAVSMVVLLGMASLTVDVGMMYRARAEAQASADAAALAGAWELLDQDRLSGGGNMTEEMAAARAIAAQYAARNVIVNDSPGVDSNSGNDTSGDIVIGYLHDPNDASASLSYSNPDQFNTVAVHVRRDETRNGPIDLFFAGIFGQLDADISASAWATFKDGVVGYRPNNQTGNAELLPLALHLDAWNNLLAGAFTSGDNYSYDEASGTVSPGSDGIQELNLYPGGGAGSLPPGNFGTVDIGPADNSTADLSRQIREGVSADDLAVFGGELMLGPDGTLPLTGETGLSGAISDDLKSIIGLPKAIPLFNAVTGPGDNSVFTVVGFAGIRIMYVKLTGAMSTKKVVIQPAFVVDDSGVTGEGSGPSHFIYKPVFLSR